MKSIRSLVRLQMGLLVLLSLLLVVLGLLRSVEVAHASGSGTWMTTGSLSVARFSHTATLLPNGKVLVAGGASSTGNMTLAELYDPNSGTWTPTGSMTVGRAGHTATLLPNGKVLVAGGLVGPTILQSAELYDPSSGTWTPTGSMSVARFSHTATLLPNGKVLVAGGAGSSGFAMASAELYKHGHGSGSDSVPQTASARAHPTTPYHPCPYHTTMSLSQPLHR